MLRIGVTGQAGFVGTHVYNTFGLYPQEIKRIPFEDVYFQNEEKLCSFVRQCDVIIHLAALNRHPDPEVLYQTNIGLIKQLIAAMEKERVKPYLLFSSSTQEELDNEYGRSKQEGRMLLEEWARRSGASFTGMVVPNVYGPFGRPNYNSFIATFCHQLTHGEKPEVLVDSEVKLIYVGALCHYIYEKIKARADKCTQIIERCVVPHDFEKKVTVILELFETYKRLYFDQGIIPLLNSRDEVNLFNTFRSYMEYAQHFPVKLVSHADTRGVFVETIKLGVGGQVSFSTTIPGITRGNHYHTRKIERFTVIQGKARIQLRKIGTNDILNFDLYGNEPSYVDIPVWYTHNITNTGDEILYTQFWINEWYDPTDGDTYFDKV